jgi:hypothetical protein
LVYEEVCAFFVPRLLTEEHTLQLKNIFS